MRAHLQEFGPFYILAAVIALIIGAVVWYEYEYPCLRYEPGTCYTTTCTYYDKDGCRAWITLPYDCQVCVERGVRK